MLELSARLSFLDSWTVRANFGVVALVVILLVFVPGVLLGRLLGVGHALRIFREDADAVLKRYTTAFTEAVEKTEYKDEKGRQESLLARTDRVLLARRKLLQPLRVTEHVYGGKLADLDKLMNGAEITQVDGKPTADGFRLYQDKINELLKAVRAEWLNTSAAGAVCALQKEMAGRRPERGPRLALKRLHRDPPSG